MITLVRIKKGTYTDQYGFEHDCWRVLEEVEVEPTGTYYSYPYYTEMIRNRYYRAKDGREWVAMVPTDYGGMTSWCRFKNGEALRESRWVPYYGEGRAHGGLPLIRKETT